MGRGRSQVFETMKHPDPRRLVAVIPLLLLGCASVDPSQRGTLMKRSMQLPSDPMEMAFDSHVHETRESLAGATQVGGPSCGCN